MFDLDGYIDGEVDTLRRKHVGVPKPKLEVEIARVSREQNARELIQRRSGPKLAIREEAKLWVPRG